MALERDSLQPCVRNFCTNYAILGEQVCQKCRYGDPVPMLPADAERKLYEDRIRLQLALKRFLKK